MADEDIEVRVAADDDIVTAREVGRRLAEVAGFSPTDSTLIATAISEVARNMVAYAGGGALRVRLVEDSGRIGLEIIASDHGPGIADLDQALRDGYSTANGMGLGLPGARRLVDDFAVVAPVGVGTTVTMRKWRGGLSA